MKTYLLLGLLAAGARPGLGQGRDTAFAVHKLFREKRGVSDGLLANAGTIAGNAHYARRDNGRPTAQEARQDALASTAFASVGLFKSARYSTEREAAILTNYAHGWPVPPDIRRKLRRKYFHRTARDLSPAQ